MMSIIMVNIMNAIIVNTFQDLRLENNKKIESLQNTCYICTLGRASFEIKGIQFDHHVSKEHNIISYVHYIVWLSEMDKDNLHDLDSYILECFERKKTNFFPINQSLSIYSKK